MIPDFCPECSIELTPKRKTLLCSDCEDNALRAVTLAPARPGTVAPKEKRDRDRMPRPKARMM